MAGETIRDVVVNTELKPVFEEFLDQVRKVAQETAKAEEAERKANEERRRGARINRTDQRRTIEGVKRTTGAVEGLSAAIASTGEVSEGGMKLISDSTNKANVGIRIMNDLLALGQVFAIKQASANAAVATSNVAVAVTATTAATAMAVLQAVMGPLILIGTAIVAGIIAMTRSSKKRKEAFEAETDTMATYISFLQRLRTAQERLAEIQEKRNKIQGKEFNLQDRVKNITSDQIARSKQAFKDLEEELNRLNPLRTSFGKKFGTATSGEAKTRADLKARLAARERLFGKGEPGFESAEAQTSKISSQLPDLKALKALTEDLAKASRMRLAALEKQNDIHDERIRKLKEELNIVGKMAKKVSDRVKQEILAKTAGAERFGLLSREEQLETKRIAAKGVNDRTFEERRRFAELTGGPGAKADLKSAAIQRGTEAGFGQVAKAAGFDQAIKNAEEQNKRFEAFAEATTDDNLKKISQLDKLKKANNTQAEKELKLLEGWTKETIDLDRRLTKMEKAFEDYKSKTRNR